MKNQDTKTRGKAIYLLFFIIFAAIAVAGGSVIGTLITNPLGTPITLNALLSSISKTESIIFIVAIFIIEAIAFLVYLIKYKKFSFRAVVNDIDRAENNLHGNSRFLTEKELSEKFGRVSHKDLPTSKINGIVVRTEKKKGVLYYSAIEKHHTLGVATTGGGKTKFLLAPTIQMNAQSAYKASLIINDMKGDLYREQSKLLEEQGYKVICINLRTPRRSLRWNPLDLIWDLYHESRKTENSEMFDKVSDNIYEMAETISPQQSGENKVWADGSRAIVAGLLWAMLEDSLDEKNQMTKEKFTFAQLSNILNKQSDYLLDYLKHRPPTSKVFDYAGLLISAADSEKTFASYMSNTQTCLIPFLDTGLQYITSGSDIDVREITKQPTALFIIIPDESPTRYVMANLMIVQLYNYLTLVASMAEGEPKLDRRVYFMLDEFANMPKITNIAKWLSVARQREIIFFLLVQSVAQLKSLYGDNDCLTILQNCNLKVYLGATETSDNEYFQKLFGSYTVYQRSASISPQVLQSIEYSGQTGMTKKDLVTLDELSTMQAGIMYFVLTREYPAKSTLVPIFDEEALKEKIFKIGTAERKIEERKIDFSSTYFSLEEREMNYNFSRYLPSQVVNTVNTVFTSEDPFLSTARDEAAASLDIEETTHLYADEREREEVSPQEIRTLDTAELEQLGLLQQPRSKPANYAFVENFVNTLKEGVGYEIKNS